MGWRPSRPTNRKTPKFRRFRRVRIILQWLRITTDLERRFKEHTQKDGKGAKYTRSRTVVSVAAAWETDSGRAEASKLEARLKKLRKDKKELLCKNPERLCDFYENGQEFSVVNL